MPARRDFAPKHGRLRSQECASEKVIEPFLRPGVAFPHGCTFGGHPVAAALSLANLDIMEKKLLDLPIVATSAATWSCRWRRR